MIHSKMAAMEQYYYLIRCSVFLLYCCCSQGLLKYPDLGVEPDLYIPNCSQDKFSANTPYQSNLFTLLSSLSYHATGFTEFYNTTVGLQTDPNTTVYGLFMCRGDIPNKQCQNCVLNATQMVATYCPLAKQAIVWHNFCIVRYSDIFFSGVSEQPQINNCDENSVSDREGSFAWTLSDTLNQVASEAANCGPAGTKKFATREALVSNEGGGTLYTLAQCMPYLSVKDCGKCLNDAIQNIAESCLGRIGGSFAYPSCRIRFELYQFYWNLTPNPHCSSDSAVSKGKRKTGSQMIVVIVVIATISVLVLGLSVYFRRKKKENVKALLGESFLEDASTTLGSLQFDLATIEAATNNFSPVNKIGKGGFGEVYKGILSHGQEIAVKRLSNGSSQGFIEFKNEILLIAKLQHKNLVTLLGFYLDQREKILVYEYVPNKSLDYFLFDPQKQRQLSWRERYQIIGGIARAIFYLHEHSRLKVIHCDLKPGNILLDNNMNPKISDFGMAKTISINEMDGRASRIVGTFGYMSPEYAKFGKFSEKSDIFSFGVIVLEIITGKRNTSNELRCMDGLLTYVWKLWSGETPLEVLDSNIKDSYCEAEVTKCIQIGLLCVQEDPNARPPMSTVVSFISSLSAILPSPREPAFFIHAQKNPVVVDVDSHSVVQATVTVSSNNMPFSINNLTMTSFFPR